MPFQLMTARASTDPGDDGLHPRAGGPGSAHLVELTAGDGHYTCVWATAVSVSERFGSPDSAPVPVLVLQGPIEVLLTDCRVAIGREDPTGGVRDGAAFGRSAMVGHVRYQWLSEVGGARRFGPGGSERLRLGWVEDTGTVMVVDLTLDDSADAGLLARDIASRAARWHLAAGSDLDAAQIGAMRALLNPPRLGDAATFTMHLVPASCVPTETTAHLGAGAAPRPPASPPPASELLTLGAGMTASVLDAPTQVVPTGPGAHVGPGATASSTEEVACWAPGAAGAQVGAPADWGPPTAGTAMANPTGAVAVGPSGIVPVVADPVTGPNVTGPVGATSVAPLAVKWGPAPPAPYDPRPTGRTRQQRVNRGWQMASGVACLLVVFAYVALVALTGRSPSSTDYGTTAAAGAGQGVVVPETTTDTSTTTSTDPNTDTTPSDTSTTPAQDPEVAALADLDALNSADLMQHVNDNRWEAQLASKAVGITDPMQTAADGSHTFKASDILAEHLTYRNDHALSGRVELLRGGDWGEGSTWHGKTLWVTMYDGGFSSSNAVRSWCRTNNPGLTAAEVTNVCVPRHMSTPPV